MELFTEGAPWENAELHVQVFKLYENWIITATDYELKQTMTYLNNHGIAIAIESGPLDATTACGQGVESFNGRAASLYALDRIREAGGTVRFIALDEPFFYGSLYDGFNACRWSPLKVAEEVNTYVQLVKRTFPDIIVGDIEPITKDSGTVQYENWISIYSAVAGSNFSFFHLDTDWNSQPNWPMVDKELETFSHDHKIQFGMIYSGDGLDDSDDAWLAHTEERIITYEAKVHGRPDHAIFQSWHEHPFYILPESSQHTFAHLILSYFKLRTVLNIIASSQSSDTLQINGKLEQVDGKPLAELPIQLFKGSTDGSGIFIESNLFPVESTKTDKNGVFRFNLTGIKSNTSLQAKYSGDANHWPAYLDIPIH